MLDLGSFLASGQASASGQDPYAVYPLTLHLVLGPFDVHSVNLNPPITAYLFRLAAAFSPDQVQMAWYTLSLILYAAVLALLVHAYPQRITPLRLAWAVALAGVWHTLELGQIYFVLLLATTVAWLLLGSKPILAGIFIGIVGAIKPNLLFWPLVLFAAGHRKPALAALASAAAISAIPLALDGPLVYEQWLHASNALTAGLELPGDSSLMAVAARLKLAPVGAGASAALAVLLLIWSMRTRPSVHRASGLGVVGALLLGPITWIGYTLLLLPELVRRQWTGLEVAAAALLVIPIWLTFGPSLGSFPGFVIIGGYGAWALILLLTAWLRTEPQPQRAAESVSGNVPVSV